jgi:hypothetical protein
MKQKSPKSSKDYSLIAVLLLTGSYILLGGVIFYQLSYDLVSGRLQAQLSQIVSGNTAQIIDEGGLLRSVTDRTEGASVNSLQQQMQNQQLQIQQQQQDLQNQIQQQQQAIQTSIDETLVRPRLELNTDLLRSLQVQENDISENQRRINERFQSTQRQIEESRQQLDITQERLQESVRDIPTQDSSKSSQSNSSSSSSSVSDGESLRNIQDLSRVIEEIEVEQEERKSSIVQRLEESSSSAINEVREIEQSLPERLEGAQEATNQESQLSQVQQRIVRRPLSQEEVTRILEDENLSEDAREVIREVSTKTDDVVSEVDRALKRILSNTDQSLTEIEQTLDTYLDEVEQTVEARLRRDVDLSQNREEIAAQVQLLRQSIQIQKDRLIERGGEDLFRDDDGDGLSNYDENNIYGTDPQVASTAGSTRTDGQKIALGFNPLIPEDSEMDFESPKETGNIVGDLYEIASVSTTPVTSDDGREVSALTLSGEALPNSFVSVYVFSTPIVAVVKTDDQGNWTYTVKEELEDGRHEVYTASVNNTGKIIARSAPTSFVKRADAVEILRANDEGGVMNVPAVAESPDADLENRYILIGFGALVTVLLLAIIVVGYQVSQEEKRST